MDWIKLYSDLLDDPKTGALPEAVQLTFVKLLLLAGECEADGTLAVTGKSLKPSEIAWRFRMAENELLTRLETLRDADLLSFKRGTWHVVNFSKRQISAEKLEEKRAAGRERKARFSANRRAGGNAVTPCGRRETDPRPAGQSESKSICIDDDDEKKVEVRARDDRKIETTHVLRSAGIHHQPVLDELVSGLEAREMDSPQFLQSFFVNRIKAECPRNPAGVLVTRLRAAMERYDKNNPPQTHVSDLQLKPISLAEPQPA